jgi:RimJ/RimL family protein N-acetyltransferase
MKLRKMTMQDADKMLEWKNYPETRKFAILSHERILKRNHLQWLANNLQYFKVITEGNDVCGAVRVQDNEVSIWIDRAFRGNGLATKAVKRVSKNGYTAKIVAENIPSLRCFIRAGYEPVSYEDGYYTLKKV